MVMHHVHLFGFMAHESWCNYGLIADKEMEYRSLRDNKSCVTVIPLLSGVPYNKRQELMVSHAGWMVTSNGLPGIAEKSLIYSTINRYCSTIQ